MVIQDKPKPRWLARVLWFYSGWFRYCGLAIAVLSGLLFLGMGISVVRDGYVLLDGAPTTAPVALAVTLGLPLAGVAIGLAIYRFVPKVRIKPHGDKGATP